MSHVNIAKGTHRGVTIQGMFPVVKAFNGKAITVKTNALSPFTVENARIKLEEGDFEYCTKEGNELPLGLVTATPGSAGTVEPNYEQEFLALESTSDSMDRVARSFQMLNEVTSAANSGIIRGLIVSGPPGIGKSYGVEETLREANLTNVLRGRDMNYEVIKGSCTAIALYQTLYNFRYTGQVVVFDDCDIVLHDGICLNLLKAALDSGGKRRISWRAESRILENADIPDSFDFDGSVIFLTNLDFNSGRQSRIQTHLEALQSRCHYMDLEISNQRDQLLRIKQVVRDGMLDTYEFSDRQVDEIVDYVHDNADYLRELSLRMVKKIADLVMARPNAWVEFVEATCFKKGAKYKRMAVAKRDEEAIRREAETESDI